MKPLILLDYDGTIHETLRIYQPAVRRAVGWLQGLGVDAPMPDERRIASWLGMSTGQMWEDFMPELPRERKLQAGRKVGTWMNESLSSAAWYPGAEEALQSLTQMGLELAILSNCDSLYARTHWEHFHMERFFDSFFACGAFHGHSKGWVLKTICEDYDRARLRASACRAVPGAGEEKQAGRAKSWEEKEEGRRVCLYIGDRHSDLEAAREASLPFLGCLYGYGREGELEGSEGLLRSVAGMPEAVRKILAG